MALAVENNTVTKARQALFDRGYKSWCENTAVAVRKKMGLQPTDPLSPYNLAEKLHVALVNLDDVPGLSDEALSHLSSSEGDDWSAVTVVCADREVVVVNPSHSYARTVSNIMHELAHVIRGHDGSRTFISADGFTIRDFDDKQEAEADWLAGALLLPRVALQILEYNGVPTDQVRDKYGVSSQLLEYRKRMTGINRQFDRRS